MKLITLAVLTSVTLLAGCGSNPMAKYFAGSPYQCDNGVTVAVRDDGSATMQTGRGSERLLRDAGGVGPAQAVYSNPQVRFSTGLPPDGRGAELEGMVPNGKARCSTGRLLGF